MERPSTNLHHFFLKIAPHCILDNHFSKIFQVGVEREEAVEVQGCLNLKEQDAISTAISLSNQMLIKVFKQARVIKYDQNFLVIPKMLFIYLASCKKCRLQHIGFTTTDFRVRFCNHKSAMITKKRTCEVAVNFNKTPHDLSDFSFQCTDQVQATANNSTNIEKLLTTKEAYCENNSQIWRSFQFSCSKAWPRILLALLALGNLRGPHLGFYNNVV